jgi:hypothetical protein
MKRRRIGGSVGRWVGGSVGRCVAYVREGADEGGGGAQGEADEDDGAAAADILGGEGGEGDGGAEEAEEVGLAHFFPHVVEQVLHWPRRLAAHLRRRRRRRRRKRKRKMKRKRKRNEEWRRREDIKNVENSDTVMIVMIGYGCFTRQDMFNKCTTDGLDASRLTGKITD